MTIITPTGYFMLIAIICCTIILIGCLLAFTSNIVRMYKDACELWQYNKIVSILTHFFVVTMTCFLAAMIGALLQSVSPLITLLLAS